MKRDKKNISDQQQINLEHFINETRSYDLRQPKPKQQTIM